jgi:acyl-CoA thioesterase I
MRPVHRRAKSLWSAFGVAWLMPASRAILPSRSYGTKPLPVKRLAVALVTIACALMLPVSLLRAEAARPVKLVVLGDSLSAGLGLGAADAFPAKLQRALTAKGVQVDVVNAGVSGDTAAGGLARLDWSVPDGTDAAIVELGANDALRGLDPKLTQAALASILKRLNERRIAVLLAGMLAPRNLGPDYAKAFDPIYPELAAAHDLILYPFILEGVAGNSALNQGDGIHPTAAGVDVMVQGMLPKVEELIARVRAGKG